MMPQKILYTDGHEVTVTDSSFQVKRNIYLLNGITKHGFLVLHPHRLPAYLLFLLGAMTLTLGLLRMMPYRAFGEVHVMSMIITGNGLAIAFGIIFILAGAIAMALMRDRYAVRIATAEGEKNVLVSSRKEYIEQIVDALNKAFMNLVSPLRVEKARKA